MLVTPSVLVIDRSAVGVMTVLPSVALLFPGASATVIGAVTVAVFVRVLVVNTATVSSSTPDPNAANNSATVNTPLVPTADLRISKTDGVASVVQGATLTYTIVATNDGPSAVTGATVTDVLPAGLTGATWTCATSGGAVCPASGSGDLSAVVDLPAFAIATFTVTGTVTGATALSNTATITGPVGYTDPSLANNSATDNTAVVPTVDLAITKVLTTGVPVPGAAVSWTITVSNAGPSAVTGATVTDLVPAAVGGATWTCAATAGSACAASGTGDITTSVDLLSGGSATFTLTGTLAPSATGTLANTATVTAPVGTNDPAGNNSSSTSDAITPQADVQVTQTGPATAVAGTDITYTVTVAVFVRVPVPLTVAVTVKVAVPPFTRSTVAFRSPVPLTGQAEPALAAQVQVAPVSCAGSGSMTVAPTTSLGPLFVTTIV